MEGGEAGSVGRPEAAATCGGLGGAGRTAEGVAMSRAEEADAWPGRGGGDNGALGGAVSPCSNPKRRPIGLQRLVKFTVAVSASQRTGES